MYNYQEPCTPLYIQCLWDPINYRESEVQCKSYNIDGQGPAMSILSRNAYPRRGSTRTLCVVSYELSRYRLALALRWGCIQETARFPILLYLLSVTHGSIFSHLTLNHTGWAVVCLLLPSGDGDSLGIRESRSLQLIAPHHIWSSGRN